MIQRSLLTTDHMIPRIFFIESLALGLTRTEVRCARNSRNIARRERSGGDRSRPLSFFDFRCFRQLMELELIWPQGLTAELDEVIVMGKQEDLSLLS